MEEERVRVAGMRGEGRAGETMENCVCEQGPVNNVPMENQPGAQLAQASMPAIENGAVLINWEEVVKRTLFRASRGDSMRLPNETCSEPTLVRAFRRDREPSRELSVRRSYEDSESGSSSSDSEVEDREIATTTPSAAFSGTGEKGVDGTQIGRISAGKCGKGFQGLAH